MTDEFANAAFFCFFANCPLFTWRQPRAAGVGCSHVGLDYHDRAFLVPATHRQHGKTGVQNVAALQVHESSGCNPAHTQKLQTWAVVRS